MHVETDNKILQNKTQNEEKYLFFKFLLNVTKGEIIINDFISNLFWVSILELFLFIIGIVLYASSPSEFDLFWTFATHVLRAIIGFWLLNKLPRTHILVEELNEIENLGIIEIENEILHKMRRIMNESSCVKILLVFYFVFTIINIIIDNIVFFVLQQRWMHTEYALENIIALVIIVTFFGKIIK